MLTHLRENDVLDGFLIPVLKCLPRWLDTQLFIIEHFNVESLVDVFLLWRQSHLLHLLVLSDPLLFTLELLDLRQ